MASPLTLRKPSFSINLHEKDRDFTRFFWLFNATDPDSESDTYMYCFRTVLFGSVSPPFMLLAALNCTIYSSTRPQHLETYGVTCM